MSIDFGTHGFVYTRELCSAIERYTVSEVRRNSQAFIHRGMQLRHAVERDLYMQGVNSVGLFRYYLSHASDVPGSRHPDLTSVEKIIAFFLCNQREVDDYRLREVTRKFLNTTKLAIRLILQRISRLGPPQIPSKRKPILINVCSIKFANYLVPVLNELPPDSYAFLVIGDSVLSGQLLKKGLPVAYLSSKESFFRQVFCSHALSYFNHLICAADSILGALSLLQPRCVLVVEGNAPTDTITAEACRLLKIPCYCLQQGWSPYVHNGFRNMNYTEVLVWGNRFAELLRQFNSSQVFRVTGSHALKVPDTSFVCTSVKTLSFFLQSPCALLGVSAFDEFLDLIADVADAYPNLRVIVREHPSFRLPVVLVDRLISYSNVSFSIPADEPVAEVISRSDLVVSVFSSVLLEAMAMNVVPLICSIGSLQQYEPAIAALGAAIEVSTAVEARSMIDQIIINPEILIPVRQAMARITAEYFSPGNAAMTIAALLQSTYTSKSLQ